MVLRWAVVDLVSCQDATIPETVQLDSHRIHAFHAYFEADVAATCILLSVDQVTRRVFGLPNAASVVKHVSEALLVLGVDKMLQGARASAVGKVLAAHLSAQHASSVDKVVQLNLDKGSQVYKILVSKIFLFYSLFKFLN